MTKLVIPEGIEMVMAFDENGYARFIEFQDGSHYDVPLPQEEGPPPADTFRIGPLNKEGPIKNINLLKIEGFEVLKWEELDKYGKVVRTLLSPRINGRPYC